MNEGTSVLYGKRTALCSLGCKVNAYETQGVRRMFEEKGAVIVDDSERADIYVINTCSVTGIADKKSRQMVHRAMKQNEEALIVVTGCYAQAAGDSVFDGDDRVIVIGSNCKDKIIESAEAWFAGREKEEKRVSDLKTDKRYMDLKIDAFSEKTRAFIKVEDGCNQFCTYCIIPYVRGRVRSRSMDDTLEEVTALARAGYKETVLTGIHLSSYGQADYEKGKGFEYGPLLELVRAVAAVPGIERVRLGSLEPRIITEEFARALAGIKEFCPQFHLSLQSGCNSVLKRMNRHYTIEEYAERVEILRAEFDRPAVTTDIIVGFPGETQEEFEESAANLEAICFSKMHVFRYSKRKGTPAATMPGQVPPQVSAARSDRLIAADELMHERYLKQFLGEEREILTETVTEKQDGFYVRGLTKRYIEVEAYAGKRRPDSNVLALVRTDSVSEGIMHGYLIGSTDNM